MLNLDDLGLGDIADALADQFGGYEHLMLIGPHTGETVYWSADTGIDGSTPIELNELNEKYPDLPPVWYEFRDSRARRRPLNGWLGSLSSMALPPTGTWPATPSPARPDAPVTWKPRCKPPAATGVTPYWSARTDW